MGFTEAALLRTITKQLELITDLLKGDDDEPMDGAPNINADTATVREVITGGQVFTGLDLTKCVGEKTRAAAREMLSAARAGAADLVAPDYKTMYETAKSVLAVREGELIEHLGMCQNVRCRLHRKHKGPCDMATEESQRIAPEDWGYKVRPLLNSHKEHQSGAAIYPEDPR